MKKKQILDLITTLTLVVSLIFVAIQINQSNHLAKATVRQTINDNDIEFLKSFLDQTVVPIANFKLQNEEELTKYEIQQIIWQQHINFRIFDNAYYQYQNGLLEEPEWLKYESIIKTLLTTNKYVGVMWKSFGENFSKNFQKKMEDLIKQAY